MYYLFMYGLPNDAFNSPDYTEFTGTNISE
jgi:hypothetical protein